MSERKLIFVACVAGALAASCSPYGEETRQPQPAPDPAANATVTDEQQQKLAEERRQAAEEAERKIAEEKERETAGTTTDQGTTDGTTGGGTESGGGDQDYSYATPVPGKEGFVFSPYNQKMIDVRDIPSGTLVQDPTYPASEKKYFRVP